MIKGKVLQKSLEAVDLWFSYFVQNFFDNVKYYVSWAEIIMELFFKLLSLACIILVIHLYWVQFEIH